MKLVQISLVSVVVLAASVLGDGAGHHHGAHHGVHHKHAPGAPAVQRKPLHPQQPLQKRPPAPRPLQRRVLPASPLKTLRKRITNLPHLRQPNLPDLSRSPLANLLRSSPLNGAVRRSQKNANRNSLKGGPKRRRPSKKNPIQYLKAEQIPGYAKFELHDVIRAREGTEIFEDGEKPDVLHYINTPEVGNIDLTDKIDERTPAKVNINSEA